MGRNLISPAVFYTGLAMSCAYSALCLGVYAAMWWTSVAGAVANRRRAR